MNMLQTKIWKFKEHITICSVWDIESEVPEVLNQRNAVFCSRFGYGAFVRCTSTRVNFILVSPWDSNKH
jgi:hypothetical protein